MQQKSAGEIGKHVADLVIAITTHLSNEVDQPVDRVLILCGIWGSQFDAKPMTALKLARLLGMSRPTVVRKLSELQAGGLVARISAGGWVMTMESAESKAKIYAMLHKCAQHIHSTAKKLSDVDAPSSEITRCY